MHESVAPDGYTLAPDQEVTFSAGQNTVVSYRGPTEEHVQPTEIVIMKGTEGAVSTPLAGAVFDLRYDQFDNGTFGDDLGTCTPDETGSCLPPGNDGPGNQFLPGNYQVTEIQAPAGYSLSAPTTITKFAGPDSGASFSFSDSPTDSIEIEKTGDDPNYDSVIGAVFTLTGPLPSTTTVATLTIAAGGQSNIVGNLLPGSYTLTETSPPTGYQAVAPQTVSLPEAAGGSPGTVTVIDVMDHVQPASATIQKLDAQTKAPLAGATFDVRFDPDHSGQYTVDLGDCTTGAGGTCVPPGNDANGELLPGMPDHRDHPAAGLRSGPGGHPGGDPHPSGRPASSPSPTRSWCPPASKSGHRQLQSRPGELRRRRDQRPRGSLTGSEMASCTTDPEGACVTAAVLTSGQTYCWLETTAPVGLSPGASGCFVADNGQGAQPITVSDAGQFVAVAVKKVAEADPTLYLPDAVFDLYRVDGGHGTDAPGPAGGCGE